MGQAEARTSLPLDGSVVQWTMDIGQWLLVNGVGLLTLLIVQ
jgi:hypothetical protein